jgi:hypothetical protein
MRGQILLCPFRCCRFASFRSELVKSIKSSRMDSALPFNVRNADVTAKWSALHFAVRADLSGPWLVHFRIPRYLGPHRRGQTSLPNDQPGCVAETTTPETLKWARGLQHLVRLGRPNDRRRRIHPDEVIQILGRSSLADQLPPSRRPPAGHIDPPGATRPSSPNGWSGAPAIPPFSAPVPNPRGKCQST